MLVRLIPVGDVQKNVLNSVVEELPSYTGVKIKSLHVLPLPRETFNQWRKQYNAERMLSLLCQIKIAKFIDKNVPTLFITEADIYYGGLNFVFTLEDPVLCASIVSLARLRPEFYDQRPNNFILCERAVKECIHTVGHHIGLEHCQHTFCVMTFSSSIADIDRKRKEFCTECKIRARLKGVQIDI